MSYLHKIEELRKRPEAYRKRFAFGVSLTIAILLFVGWGIVSAYQFTHMTSEGKSAVKVISPVSFIKAKWDSYFSRTPTSSSTATEALSTTSMPIVDQTAGVGFSDATTSTSSTSYSQDSSSSSNLVQ